MLVLAFASSTSKTFLNKTPVNTRLNENRHIKPQKYAESGYPQQLGNQNQASMARTAYNEPSSKNGRKPSLSIGQVLIFPLSRSSSESTALTPLITGSVLPRYDRPRGRLRSCSLTWSGKTAPGHDHQTPRHLWPADQMPGVYPAPWS